MAKHNKSLFVVDLKEGDYIGDRKNGGEFFMVKNVETKKDKNGGDYQVMVLFDRTGEVNAISFKSLLRDVAFDDIKLVKVAANVDRYPVTGKLQVKIDQIRVAEERDEDFYEPEDLIRKAPLESEEMYDYIYGVAKGFADSDLKAITCEFLEENEERLMYWPAASKNHHAEYGGLLYHMYRMLKTGDAICDIYNAEVPYINKELVLAGVILHDMEKLDEILSDENGISPGYSDEGMLLGHIVMGVKAVDEMAIRLDIPAEKRIMLEHMILSHHYEPEFGSPKKPLFPEAEILHYLDMIDAKMFDFQAALENVMPGEFSDKIWTLDNRKLYKSTIE